jgi:hypothetical protein
MKANPDGVGSSRPRPPAVTIVAAIFLLVAVKGAISTVLSLHSAQILFPPGGGLVNGELLGEVLGPHAIIAAARYAAFGIIALLAGIVLLQMRPRAWLFAMVVAVVVLAVQLLLWWQGDADYLSMALAVAVVLLMNQTEIRQAFRRDAPA